MGNGGENDRTGRKFFSRKEADASMLVLRDAASISHPGRIAMPIVMYSNNNISSLKTSPLGVCFGQCTFFAKLSKDRDCVNTDASTIESNATAAQSLFMLDSGSYDASRNRIFAL